jgi:DNA-directed RNA polymerase subunit RPC12/RpoP
MNPPNANFNIDPSQLKLFKCENCGGKLFENVTAIGKVPRLSIASPTDVIAPIPVWRCADCGEILHSLLPRGINFNDDGDDNDNANEANPEGSGGLILG